MSEAKEKDRLLSQIKAQTSFENIKNLSKYIDELETSRYVHTAKEEGGGIVAVRLTAEGQRFLESGGYTRLYRKRLNQKFWYGFWFVIGVAATKITEKLIDIIFP